jgi:GT2 family glycosyltransferase
MRVKPPRYDARVGIVVITHNRATQVRHTLSRLTSLGPYQIVVVDNASTDGTPRMVRQEFPHVTVVPLKANLGAASRDVGIHQLATSYVALCDDDTWWAPGGLERGADLLDAHPRLAIISARVLVGPEEREDSACREMAETPLKPTEPLPGFPILGFLAGATLARRDALIEVGGFEPRFFIGCEERLMAVDLMARNWSLAYVPELVVHHHPSKLRDSSARSWLLLRNTLWFTWLRRPLPRAVAATLKLAGRAIRDQTARRALVEAASGMRWVARSRRPLPEPVERGLRQIDRPGGPLRRRVFPSGGRPVR